MSEQSDVQPEAAEAEAAEEPSYQPRNVKIVQPEGQAEPTAVRGDEDPNDPEGEAGGGAA